ncbi:unnamed protein product [Cylindrotheca closterium]|uniref:Uncharacterized protein n=1 Tax=Cylindrotheca closterium TaxID=2856 RepID=A0AAD2G3C7_9STRA|nr:unnamed protein product [Cylindrotheca closterium]
MTTVTDMTITTSIHKHDKRDVMENVKKTPTGMKKKAFSISSTSSRQKKPARDTKNGPMRSSPSSCDNSSQDSDTINEAIDIINSNKEDDEPTPPPPSHRRTSSSSSYRLTRGGGGSSVNLQTEGSDSSSGPIMTRGHGSSVSLRIESDLDPRAASELLLDNSDRLSLLVSNSHTNLAGLADFSSSSSESDCDEF